MRAVCGERPGDEPGDQHAAEDQRHFVLEHAQGLLPYALAIAAASFIYIALSDLLPEMMRRSRLRESLPEVALVFCGVLVAWLVTGAFATHGAH
ncbi:MAG TPA: hypothetical protein VM528_04340 [Burkholderiaceae bacterium]|nr:hypothetical protein [Burkholderiaceae bacterium]